MCGIVAGISTHNICPLLMAGLHSLEYRGYDSAGIAILNRDIERVRTLGKVAELQVAVDKQKLSGRIGIAHTRWATHGIPAQDNAHPHISGGRVVIVHNGIIENYETLKQQQAQLGFNFSSATDSEVVAHQIMYYLQQSYPLLEAVAHATRDLQGAYALGVLDRENPDRIIAARQASPLVIGIGSMGCYVASDAIALLDYADRFIYMQNGDLAELSEHEVKIYDQQLKPVQRKVEPASIDKTTTDLSGYTHYMLKEIFEQPRAVADTLEGRVISGRLPDEIIGNDASAMLSKTRAVQVVACGTSYHAALIASHWIEELTALACHAEIASEFRYRQRHVDDNTLFIALSQSGETADTLAALEIALHNPAYHASLAICNVAQSSLVRESQFTLMTHAGPEIGVASTKAFTTQLAALLMLAILIGKHHPAPKDVLDSVMQQLMHLPVQLEDVLALEPQIKTLAEQYVDKHNALFLGRGLHYPIAMEGALKMKEISYIHAEAYPAGELKHGPLALVDNHMPVIAVAPNNPLLAKLKSNLEEVRARGGVMHVFADRNAGLQQFGGGNITIISMDTPGNEVSPILFTVPLQMLAYHTALIKGTDIDQPRNLAKSVTVE